jgi:hypothetical protein
VIVSIGAVRFDMGHGIVDEFAVVIDPIDAESRGLRLDAATVLWWFEQSEEARAGWLAADAVKLEYALMALHYWMVQGGEDMEVWCKGAAFDAPLLEAAFAVCGEPVPWKYWMVKCYRTVAKEWREVSVGLRSGVAHDALDDARHQALHLLQIEEHQAGARDALADRRVRHNKAVMLGIFDPNKMPAYQPMEGDCLDRGEHRCVVLALDGNMVQAWVDGVVSWMPEAEWVWQAQKTLANGAVLVRKEGGVV